MDNFKLDVCAIGSDCLCDTLKIALRDRKIQGYLIDPERGMILFSSIDDTDRKRVVPFPFYADNQFVSVFVSAWLKTTKITEDEPDIDGDTRVGWRVYTSDWGCAEGYASNSVCAIQPFWAMYGK